MEWYVIDGHYWIELRIYEREPKDVRDIFRAAPTATAPTQSNFNTAERFLPGEEDSRNNTHRNEPEREDDLTSKRNRKRNEYEEQKKV